MLNSRTNSVFVLIIALCALPGQVMANDAPTDNAQLMEMLAERDAIIIELQHSVAELRQRLADVEGKLNGASTDRSSPEQDGRPVPASDQPRQSTNSTEPGRLAVDEIAAERALERTLVQAGALLLPRGAFELTPSFTMGINDFQLETALDAGAGEELGILRVDRTDYTLGLTARYGLPYDSQLELGIPFRSVTEESSLTTLGGTAGDFSRTGRAAGDLVVGISKTLLREHGLAPDVVGRLSWNTGTGSETDNDVFLGGGFSSLTGALSAVKRLDPLAIFFSLEYEDSNGSGGFEPGNALEVSLGTGLAVSPATSLSAAVTNRSVSKSRFAGETLENSDLDVTSLTLAFSTIFSRGKLLNLYTEIGMSDDAPDYSLGFAMPVRMQ